MDPALASIIAALIGAAASVLVALVGKARTGGDRSVAQRSAPVPVTNVRVWTVFVALLVLWMAGGVLLFHPEWGRINFVLLPVLTIALALIWPVRGWAAAAVVLMLYSINLFVEPVGKLLAGTTFMPGPAYLWIFPLVGIGNALLVAALAHWRSRAWHGPEAAGTGPSALVEQIERLRVLHESGALTDAEFERAKARLLE